MAMEAGAAAAATAGVGMGLFSYNRNNYMFDQKQHYTRFTAGVNMAIAQTGMYQQDIAQLTDLTVSRQDCMHGIAAMGLTILTAIYCPGRVGFHEPPPPGWLMGLEMVNVAGCYLFLALSLWFAMHASMRADTASTHMLTRFVRLPIPSQAMLDQARKFLSSYEEQPLKEVFRVPFTRHQGKSGSNQGGYNEDRDIDQAAASRSRHGYDVPAWYRKEKAVDNSHMNETIQSMMPLDAQGTAPEHFEAYRELQMEWWPYDVYARVSIFLAFTHLLHCWAFLQIGYLFQEVRAMWACAIVMLQMFTLQQVVLTLDIMPDGFPFHRIGPFGLWFAYFAAVIEYKRWYDPVVQQFGFVLVYCAYATQLIYTIQLYRLCAPSEGAPAVAESPGAAWWPGEWRLPSAFQHAVWLVAPPKQLEDGQVDIVKEVRDAQTGQTPTAGTADAAAKRLDVHRALGKHGESAAWFSVKVGLLSLIVAWIWLVVGFTWEVMNQGTTHPSFLMAPGMPQHSRDPRYRPAKLAKKAPTEVGTGGIHGPAEGVHMEAVHRRLTEIAAGSAADVDRKAVTAKLRELLPLLQGLAIDGVATKVATSVFPAAPAAVSVQWPAMFEPSVVACGVDDVVALSRHGRGVRLALASAESARPFALHGIAGHGAVISATWSEQELLVVTTVGVVLECNSNGSTHSTWACVVIKGPVLPVSSSSKVAVSRTSSGDLRAAVVLDDDTVAFFVRGAPEDAKWVIQGEVRLPVLPVSIAFAEGGSLLLAVADGSVTELRLADGSSVRVREPNAGHDGHVWASVCRQRKSGDLFRLATPKQVGVQAKLILS